MTATDYLYELDQVTQSIIHAVLERQREGTSDFVRIPTADKTIPLHRNWTLAELRRLRKQYLQANKLHPIPCDRIASMFVEFLLTHVGVGE